MGKRVDYSDMRACMTASNDLIGQWNKQISAVAKQGKSIVASNNIAGNKANCVKDYLSTVYNYADSMFSILMQTFTSNFIIYTSKDYPAIDAAYDAVIDEDELSKKYSDITQQRSQLRQIGILAENWIKYVSDIVSPLNMDLNDADTQFNSVLLRLDDLDNEINELESMHISNDFADIDAMISSLESYITELYNQSESFKTDFSMMRFYSLASVHPLLAAAQTAYNNLTANKASVELAIKNLEEVHAQEQAELAKRKERAEWIKIGASAVISLITAAVVVVAPASVIVFGAASGAVKSLVSAVADEYAENGWNPNDWDNNNIVISSCIGGITGMVESLVPAGAGHCVKAGIKAASSALEGALSTSYDQFTSSGKISDVKGVVTNALLDGSSTFVGSLAGSAVSDSAKDFVKQNKTVKYFAENVVGGAQHFEAALRVEGAAKLSSGITKRFTSTATKETSGFIASLLDGKSVSEAYDEHSIISESLKKATDIKLIASDSISAITTAATDNPLYKSEKKLEMRRIAGEAHEYSVYGDAPDLSGKKNGWKDWDFRTHQENATEDMAWEQERELVMHGKGSRDWTASQQEELIRTGKVSGFEAHFINASGHDHSMEDLSFKEQSKLYDINNVQFVTQWEHDAVHTENKITYASEGLIDTKTGELVTNGLGQVPDKRPIINLTDTIDSSQANLLDKLGASFGYGRGKE